VYWLLYRRTRWQNALLLVASYVFYGAWNWRFLFLLWGSTAIDFIAGLQMNRASTPARRRAWLLTSLTYNLGMLAFFKYFNFGVDTLAVVLRHVGSLIRPRCGHPPRGDLVLHLPVDRLHP
jgi:D-alanyl-lipoteichoic acid acyltransferase DltB (MBOAT superfamily)